MVCHVLCLRHGIPVWQHTGQSTSATNRRRCDITSDVKSDKEQSLLSDSLVAVPCYCSTGNIDSGSGSDAVVVVVVVLVVVLVVVVVVVVVLVVVAHLISPHGLSEQPSTVVTVSMTLVDIYESLNQYDYDEMTMNL